MTLTLVADEFGLLHAAVPHPCRPKQNIQVMVLQAEDGWWTYVDGERVPGHFQSAQQAGRAAAKAIDSFRSLADTATAREELPDVVSKIPRSSARGRKTFGHFQMSRGAIAASVAIAFSVLSVVVVQATGVLKGDALAAKDATTTIEQDDLVVSSVKTNASSLGSQTQPRKIPTAAVPAAPAADDTVQVPRLQPAPGRKTAIPELPASNPVSLELRTREELDDASTVDTVRVEPSSAVTEPPATTADQPVLNQAADEQLATLATEDVAHASRKLETDFEDADSLAASHEAANLRTPEGEQSTGDTEALQQPATTVRSRAAERRRATQVRVRDARSRARARIRRARASRKRRASRRRTASVRARHHRRVRRSKQRLQGKALRRAIRKQRGRKFRRAYRAAFGKN